MLNENTIYSLQMHETMEGSVPFALEKFSYLSVYKNMGEKTEKSNYRSITLLSCMSKILVKVIYKSLFEYCVSHELLIRENSGFKRNDYS